MKWPNNEVRDYFLGHAIEFMKASAKCRRRNTRYAQHLKPREIFYKGRHLITVPVYAATWGVDTLANKLYVMCCEGIPKKRT